MKRTAKPTFFIVALLIFALAYTTFFGVYTTFGDRQDTVLRGVSDIRFGIDIRGGIDVTFGPVDESVSVSQANLDGAKDIIVRRLIANGITDYEAYTDLTNKQVIVRFPWKADEAEYDSAKAIEELGKTARLEFHYGGSTTDENGKAKPEGDLILSGAQVKSAEPATQQDNDTSTLTNIVILNLNDSAKEAFSEATAKQKGTGTISIWLDNEMISNANVNDHITDGVAIISGGFPEYSDAVSLANLINSGALPFSIEVKSSGVISASLGSKALNVMLWAGIVAFALVSLFMVLYYRLPGVVAVISLLGQVAGSLAVVSGYFSFFNGFTLTLPGIAGIIISIGMGLDANIITSERIKEEIRAGKTIDGALQKGSEESFWAIFDGNITVIIVAVILMGVFGPPSGFWSKVLYPVLFLFPTATTGSVYSFGFTLFAGIIFNFIMGVYASRAMLKSLCRFRLFRKPWLLGGERS
ncbi:MAG: protein translocase subunit SecD [Clostridia bacterium]|nr:protein translocase subunit SecD [Clostridia bacterium]